MTITQLFRHQRLKKKAFTYNVTVPAVNKPVSLDSVKNFLKISLADKTQDDLLNLFIDAATECGEKYTSKDFITKTYITFRDDFNVFCDEDINITFELRRSKVSDVTSVKYFTGGVLTTVPTTVWGFTNVNDYSQIFLKEDQEWPTDIDDVPQVIEITFTSGFGADSSFVPGDVKIALLSHIAFMYENRGDCNTGDIGDSLPLNVRTLYGKVRLINIGSCS